MILASIKRRQFYLQTVWGLQNVRAELRWYSGTDCSRWQTVKLSWDRAHPNYFIAYNGEINTLRGNVNFPNVYKPNASRNSGFRPFLAIIYHYQILKNGQCFATFQTYGIVQVR
jgi:hypothetical protein